MKLTPKEQLSLVERYAPILWLHDREAFLPVDVARMVDVCELYRKGKPPKKERWEKTPDALGKIKDSKHTYLKIPDLDMQSFEVSAADRARLGKMGPDAVKELARERYGYDIARHGIPSRGKNQPKYYARVSTISIRRRRDEPFTKWYERRDPGIFGGYVVVEYFFFFVYNDAWNQHQGDWDCQFELYLREDRAYMISYLHNTRWATKLWPVSNSDIAGWLKHWRKLKKHELGEAYAIDRHPFVFLTQGAHAGYPTPGFTLHGFDIPGIISRDDLLSNTDQRQIARGCILPSSVSEDVVRDALQKAGIGQDRFQIGRWQVPELVLEKDPVQPWLRYRGRWGEESRYKGYHGPKEPPITKRPNKRNFKKVIPAGYTSGSVLRNWHGM